jgi:hypothetical protein
MHRRSNRALVNYGHGGPLLVGVTWQSPDIYHQAGIERGTATFNFYGPGDNLANIVAHHSKILLTKR